jgi:hypothetical protein
MTAAPHLTRPSSAPAVSVVWGVAGDVIHIEHERHMLWRECDRVIRAYHCVFCKQHLANRGQLEMHLELGGQHYVVSYCTRHGYEACEDPRR